MQLSEIFEEQVHAFGNFLTLQLIHDFLKALINTTNIFGNKQEKNRKKK